MRMELDYVAPPDVRAVIASLGRTEDVRFSPDNTRLAVACFNRNQVAVFDITVVAAVAGTRVELMSCVELSSPALRAPHGLDFIDDETLIVANRAGDVVVLEVPPAEIGSRTRDTPPSRVWPAGGTSLLDGPGSIAVVNGERDLREILICNNSGHTVTKHLLDAGAGHASRSGEVLLRKWLDIPDGVCVSRDGQWLAVSNHNTHSVLLYDAARALNERSDPDGILRGVQYPHGLRFSADGEHLVVADAGAPYVHVYARGPAGWRGVRSPAATFTIMSEAVFRRGRHNPQEGGPKGLDIDRGASVLVVTSEYQTLAFFEASAMLEGAAVEYASTPSLDYELFLLEERRLAKGRVRRAEEAVEAMKRSRWWRITAPLRRLTSGPLTR